MREERDAERIGFACESLSPSWRTTATASLKSSPFPTMIPSADPSLPPPPPFPPPDTAVWTLEFILRQPIPDFLAHQILLSLPLPSPLPTLLSKSILLRRLSSDLSRRSISLRTLHTLELIHELDYNTRPSGPMRLAYCAVAVECTLSSLRDGGDFPGAVERIWRQRMVDLEQSEAACLAPKAVKWWRGQMEEALAKDDARARLAKRKTRKEALEAVRVYLKHAMDGMGQPFLDIAANSFPWRAAGLRESQTGDNLKMQSKLQTRIDDHEKQPPNGPVVSDHDRCSVSMVDHMLTPVASKAAEDPLADALATASMVLASRFDVAPNIEEPRESQPIDVLMNIDGPLENLNEVEGHESIGEGCVASNPKEARDQDGCSLRKYDRLPAPEVRKVSEALKTSCANLATVVENPLPDAVITASNILASRFTEARNDSRSKENEHVSATEISTKVSCPESFDRETVCCTDSIVVQLSRLADLDMPGPRDLEGTKGMVPINAPEQSIEEGSNATLEKGTNAIYLGNEYSLVQRPSLMERNRTAHTFEWDEGSIDSSTESSLITVKKRGLPNSMRKDMSLLKLPENNSLIKQRIRKKWTLLEEDTLRQAVEKYGVGNWKLIQSSYKEIFEDRMPGDLKDKWRNMTKH